MLVGLVLVGLVLVGLALVSLVLVGLVLVRILEMLVHLKMGLKVVPGVHILSLLA